jgi:sugar lactone lactonase YvrE
VVLAVVAMAGLMVPQVQADVLVTSSFNSSVLRYSDAGAFLEVFVPPGGGGLSAPDLGIISGPDGNVYVDSFGNGAVMRYDVNTGANLPAGGNPGAQFVAAGAGGLAGTEGIGFGGPNGNLYAASAFNNTVKRYNPTTGAFLDTIVPAGSGGLALSNDLHFGPDGNLYVSNGDFSGKVLRYNPATGAPLPGLGQVMANFITPVPGQLANGFAFGPDGNLYVSFDNQFRIAKYNGTTGALINANFVPPGSGGIGFIDGIAFGPDGNLYATSRLTGAMSNRVMKYDGQTGAFLGVFIGPGNGLSEPAGLAFVPAAVPEPGSVALLGVAVLDLAGYGRWRLHRRAKGARKGVRNLFG